MISVLLIATGLSIRQSEMHRALTVGLNDAARLIPPEIWAMLSLFGLGWATVILVCATDRSGVEGRVVLLALVLGGLLTHLLKHWISDPRPGLVIPEGLQIIGMPILHGGSMPSGHTLAAFCMASLFNARMRRKKDLSEARSHLWISVALWSLAACVGLSRIAVGAHWPSDVLVGAGLGMLVAAIASRLVLLWPEQGAGRFPALVISLELIAAAVAVVEEPGLQSIVWAQYLFAGLTIASASARVSRWWAGHGSVR